MSEWILSNGLAGVHNDIRLATKLLLLLLLLLLLVLYYTTATILFHAAAAATTTTTTIATSKSTTTNTVTVTVYTIKLPSVMVGVAYNWTEIWWQPWVASTVGVSRWLQQSSSYYYITDINAVWRSFLRIQLTDQELPRSNAANGCVSLNCLSFLQCFDIVSSWQKGIWPVRNYINYHHRFSFKQVKEADEGRNWLPDSLG